MISVALCTFNGEKYISEQLDSILSQSVPVDEIIVCDDCSTDATKQILRQYAMQFPFIRLIENERNLGYIRNFEKAIRLCQGDYIFLSDQDDIWHSDKVAKSVSYLSGSGMYGAFTNARIIDHEGAFLGWTLFGVLQLEPYIQKGFLQKNIFGLLCFRGNFVTGATLVLTRMGKEKVLPFKTPLNTPHPIIHDGWIALRLSGMNKLGFIDTPLIDYRTHSEQQIGLNVTFPPPLRPDFFAACLEGKGDINQLMRRRLSFGRLSKSLGFGENERRLSYHTYFEFWKKNRSKGPKILFEWILLLLTEVFVWLKLDSSRFRKYYLKLSKII